MRIQFSFVGEATMQRRDNLVVDLPLVPREGEVVNVAGVSQAHTVVRTVVWYPTHDDEGEPVDEPFVYVVLGQPRR